MQVHEFYKRYYLVNKGQRKEKEKYQMNIRTHTRVCVYHFTKERRSKVHKTKYRRRKRGNIGENNDEDDRLTTIRRLAERDAVKGH